MRKWRGLQLLLIVIFAIFLISACGGESSSEEGNVPSSSTESEGQSSNQEGTEGTKGAAGTDTEAPVEQAKDWTNEKFEIVFYANNMETEEDIDLRYGNPLRAKFPNMTFKYIQATQGNSLAELITSGTRFDIFFNSIGNYENQAFQHEIQYDMTQLIEEHDVDLSTLEPALLEGIKQASDGKMYMLPVQSNNFVVYYNIDLFEKFGVPFPTDGMTWDELADLSVRMTRVEEDQLYLGYAHSPNHMPRLNPMSLAKADMETGMPTVNTDERWKTFYDKFFVAPFRSSVYENYFNQENASIPGLNHFTKDKNVAMFVYLSSLMQLADQYLNEINWDVVSMPTMEANLEMGTQPYPIYIGMTQMAENKDAAMHILKYLISTEYQTEMAKQGIIPSLSDKTVQSQLGADMEGAAKGKNWGAVFYNKYFAPVAPMGPYDANLANIYAKYGNELTKGNLDINTMLRDAEEEATMKIEELKQLQ